MEPQLDRRGTVDVRVAHIICEGPTEQSFVKNILAPEFPNLILKPYNFKGNIPYPTVLKAILVFLSTRPANSYCTTFIDFYGLPPGYPAFGSSHADIERAVQEDVEGRIGSARFRAYLSLHEFEALLFSDTAALSEAMQAPGAAFALNRIRMQFRTREQINDQRDTAPSRRIKAVHSPFNKRVDGISAAQAIGLPRMTAECPHFAKWIEWFRSIPA